MKVWLPRMEKKRAGNGHRMLSVKTCQKGGVSRYLYDRIENNLSDSGASEPTCLVSNHLVEEERIGCLTLILFLSSSELVSVVISLPCDAFVCN